MDTPKMRPIPAEEVPKVLALLIACYSGEETDKKQPGRAQRPRPSAREVVELRRA